jgi:chromosome segregation ATPase
MMTKDELKALAKEADAAVSTLEIIAEKLQAVKDELETKRDEAKEKLEKLTEKRDAAQEKFDSLSERAAEGPRGTKLQEKIEELTDLIDGEIEPGVTLDSLVESLDAEMDRLSILDDFDPADVRAFADGVDVFADECDESLLDAEVSEEGD